MEKMTTIVIDTKGADAGARPLIVGAAQALEKFPDLAVLLVGDAREIGEVCQQINMPMDRVEILDAPEQITNFDNPAEAIYHKQDSSMLMAMQALSQREELFGMLSAGNTAVLLTGAMRYLSGKERVRPVLAAVLPAADGSFTCIVDTGATIDCNSTMLHHFARLGSAFMKDMYGIESPRVGLLSNGAEASKGNKLVKETHPILAADESLNFIGNVEGSNALSGVCDVLVCDGFAGNQVLKVTEGTATRIITDIVKYAKRTGNQEIMTLVGHLMSVYDISALGGGNILGAAKPIIKLRGNAGEKTVVSTAEMLLHMARNEAIFDKAKNKI